MITMNISNTIINTNTTITNILQTTFAYSIQNKLRQQKQLYQVQSTMSCYNWLIKKIALVHLNPKMSLQLAHKQNCFNIGLNERLIKKLYLIQSVKNNVYHITIKLIGCIVAFYFVNNKRQRELGN